MLKTEAKSFNGSQFGSECIGLAIAQARDDDFNASQDATPGE